MLGGYKNSSKSSKECVISKNHTPTLDIEPKKFMFFNEVRPFLLY